MSLIPLHSYPLYRSSLPSNTIYSPFPQEVVPSWRHGRNAPSPFQPDTHWQLPPYTHPPFYPLFYLPTLIERRFFLHYLSNEQILTLPCRQTIWVQISPEKIVKSEWQVSVPRQGKTDHPICPL